MNVSGAKFPELSTEFLDLKFYLFYSSGGNNLVTALNSILPMKACGLWDSEPHFINSQ